MKKQLNRLEVKLDDLTKQVVDHLIVAEKRISRLETVQKGFIWGIGSAIILCFGYFLQFLS
jgi:SMC interacting uncharacterized protein involved in chromosome segregation